MLLAAEAHPLSCKRKECAFPRPLHAACRSRLLTCRLLLVLLVPLVQITNETRRIAELLNQVREADRSRVVAAAAAAAIVVVAVIVEEVV